MLLAGGPEDNKQEIESTKTVRSTPKKEQTLPKEESKTKQIPDESIANSNKLPSWDKIVNGLKSSGKIMLYTNLINTSINEINDMTVGIEFPNGITSFGKTVLEKPENRQELERLISMEYGKVMQIKYIDKKEQTVKQNNTSSIEVFAKGLDIPIQISED